MAEMWKNRENQTGVFNDPNGQPHQQEVARKFLLIVSLYPLTHEHQLAYGHLKKGNLLWSIHIATQIHE